MYNFYLIHIIKFETNKKLMLDNNHDTRSAKYSEKEVLQVPSAPRLRPQPAPSHFMELNLG
jgi:hypothetical protein